LINKKLETKRQKKVNKIKNGINGINYDRILVSSKKNKNIDEAILNDSSIISIKDILKNKDLYSRFISTEKKQNFHKNAELYFIQEIKNIPAQIENLKLVKSSNLYDDISSISTIFKKDDNYTSSDSNTEEVQNKSNNYLQIKYIFKKEPKDSKKKNITNTYSFLNRYGIRLKKNLKTNYKLNELLYLKEDFYQPYIDKNEYIYKFDKSNGEENNKKIKFKNKRFMKYEESRYLIKIKKIEIVKEENYYLSDINFKDWRIKSKLEDNTFNIFDDFKFNNNNEKNNIKKEKKIEQLKYPHRYYVKYIVELIDEIIVKKEKKII